MEAKGSGVRDLSLFPVGYTLQELSTARSCLTQGQGGESLSSTPTCTMTRMMRQLVRKILEGSSSGWKRH